MTDLLTACPAGSEAQSSKADPFSADRQGLDEAEREDQYGRVIVLPAHAGRIERNLFP
jgi:hypothetical protein